MIEKKIDYQRVLTFLGHQNITISDNLEALIKDIMEEVTKLTQIKFCHQTYDADFLPNSSKNVVLMGITLGAELDRRICLYEKTYVTKAIIADACANALMEEVISQLEKEFSEHSPILCPGNEGIPIEWNKIIATILDTPKRIGLHVTERYSLIPQKSLIGFMYPSNIQQCAKEKCDRCTNINCQFRKKRTI